MLGLRPKAEALGYLEATPHSLGTTQGGREFDGGALEDGDLALDADELFVGCGVCGCGWCGEGVGFESGGDGVEACG